MDGFDDLDTGTQDDDQLLNDDGGAQDGTGSDGNDGEGGGGEKFFLTVNDRTKYRTQADAVKAFDAAGQRIAQLSPWEKEVSQAFGGLTPQQTKQIISEYVQLKRAERSSAASAKKDGSPTESVSQLTAEQKEVVDFLKKNGFITKDAADALRKEIDELKNGTQELRESTDSQRLSGLVDIGRTTLSAELTAAKLAPEKAKAFERYITAWVNEDETRVERFYKGGDETKAVIKEGFKAVCADFGITPASQARPNLNAARDKNKVLNRNPQRLPQSGSGSAQRSPKPQNEGLTPDVHRRAAEVFASIANGGEE